MLALSHARVAADLRSDRHPFGSQDPRAWVYESAAIRHNQAKGEPNTIIDWPVAVGIFAATVRSLVFLGMF